jgi:hypothetical protein
MLKLLFSAAALFSKGPAGSCRVARPDGDGTADEERTRRQERGNWFRSRFLISRSSK